jgi:hypothetical protein
MKTEIYIHKNKNPKYFLDSGAININELGNCSIWEGHHTFESAEKSKLWNSKSDMIIPYYIDSDKCCPICTRNSKIVNIGDKIINCSIKFCEACSDNIKTGDIFLISQVLNRPIVVIFRESKDIVNNEIKFKEFIDKIKLIKNSKNDPLNKHIEGDLIPLIKIQRSKEINYLKKLYKKDFKYIYSFPVSNNYIFLIRSNNRLNNDQKIFLDKTQYFNSEEYFKDGPLKGFTFKESLLGV